MIINSFLTKKSNSIKTASHLVTLLFNKNCKYLVKTSSLYGYIPLLITTKLILLKIIVPKILPVPSLINKLENNII